MKAKGQTYYQAGPKVPVIWTEGGGRRRYPFLVVMEINPATGKVDRRLIKKAGRLDYVRMG
jgi:hypothetical protein